MGQAVPIFNKTPLTPPPAAPHTAHAPTPVPRYKYRSAGRAAPFQKGRPRWPRASGRLLASPVIKGQRTLYGLPRPDAEAAADMRRIGHHAEALPSAAHGYRHNVGVFVFAIKIHLLKAVVVRPSIKPAWEKE